MTDAAELYALPSRAALRSAAEAGVACSIRVWGPEGPTETAIDPAVVEVDREAFRLPDGAVVPHHGAGAGAALPEIVARDRETVLMEDVRSSIRDLCEESRLHYVHVDDGATATIVDVADVHCARAGLFVKPTLGCSSDQIASLRMSPRSIRIELTRGRIRIAA